MSILANTATSPPVELSATEAAVVRDVARRVCSAADGFVDSPEWIDINRHAWDEMPQTLRRATRQFRRHSGSRGSLLIRGLPVSDAAAPLPPTPDRPGSVQRLATLPAAVLMMTACGLGEPGAFQAEKSGALVQDVVPVPAQENFQGNAGSVLLSFHNENAFHDHRPDYVMLLCLRPDHLGEAGLRTACIRELLPLLSRQSTDALWRAEFITEPPPSFGDARGTAVPHAVLTGSADDPDLRVDLNATRPTTPDAREAMLELQQLFDRTAHTIQLRAGDLAIVDNRITVHGRSAFQPRYDGKDRWLQRTFVFIDLRRSRDHRPTDGYILTR